MPNTADLPTHLGFILDGNRRWAKSKGLPPLEGHRKGYKNFEKIAEAAIERGVRYVSAYVFSTENWNRSKEEVSYLMDLLYRVATTEVDRVHEKNIRVRFLGSETRLSEKIVKAIRSAEEKTKGNTKGTIAFCLNYGGQLELAEAMQSMVRSGIAADDITPDKIAEHLYAPDMPPVDLIVRTSGEQRLSNFMLWRAAYSELLFVPEHWPAFTEESLDAALAEYAKRQRRFGG